MIFFDKNKKIKPKWHRDSVFLHYTGNMLGIGCSIFSKLALKRINLLKQRKDNKGYIVLIPEIEWLSRYKIEIDNDVKRLMQQYWPGELTFVLKNSNIQFKEVSNNGYTAFRIPSNSYLREFISEINEPIISTSINSANKQPMLDLFQIKKTRQEWFDFTVIYDEMAEFNSVPSTIIKFDENDFICLREGTIPFNKIIESYNHPLILFICTANICRSPMAEYYARNLIEQQKLPFIVKSAGFLLGGVNISPFSAEVLKESGIDANNHISTQINHELISDSWLILTMTQSHKDMLLDLEPNAIYKTFSLSEFCGLKYSNSKFYGISSDIEDPFGLDIYFYREAFKKVKERIDYVIEFISKE